MIVGILAILVTAFTVAMRTERSASHNFAERERAQAIANGMLHRILADQSAPYIALTGSFLGPFVTDSNTQLPTTSSSSTYLADETVQGNYAMLTQIYTMPPSPVDSSGKPLVSSSNHLVRLSGTTTTNTPSNWAYNAAYWGYARQNPNNAGFYNYSPLDASGKPTAPSWINYYDSTGTNQIGQVAYAIWDEAGKIDINMAGPDGTDSTGTNFISGRMNGMAPHDLKFEYLASDPLGLISYLDNQNGRQRSDFALRAIVPTTVTNAPAPNGTGDDRSIFSVEELLNRQVTGSDNLITSVDAVKALDVTTLSRDFEVRPEWDGNRAPASAVSYLKSYINDPTLHTLFQGANSQGGPNLVSDLVSSKDPTNLLDALTINADLKANNIVATDEWRQVVRLLAILRMALPPNKPYVRTGSAAGGNEDVSVPATANLWDDQDVYAIALNILQASDPANDQELTAYNSASGQFSGQPYQDPSVRTGVRLSPYIVETAISAQRLSGSSVLVTEYQKAWNPYPIELDGGTGADAIPYRYGAAWSGGAWPFQAGTAVGSDSAVTGLFDNADGPANLENLQPPFQTDPTKRHFMPNTFTILPHHSRMLTLGKKHDLVLYSKPWMYNGNYYQIHNTTFGGSSLNPQSIAFSFTGGAFTGIPYLNNPKGGTDWVNMGTYFVIPASLMDAASKNWFSYQIDDPRMGQMARYTPNAPVQNYPASTTGTPATTPENGPNGVQRLYSIIGNLNTTSSSPLLNYTPMTYSWQPLPGKQTLYDSQSGWTTPDITSRSTNNLYGTAALLPGCNYNFLAPNDLPKTWAGMSATQKYHAALATFALPGRPFANLGEIATVYANRPWTTLSMAQNLPIPTGTNIKTTTGSTSIPNARLALLLDYYTTVGTTTNPTTDVNLNYRVTAQTDPPPPAGMANANITKRQQNNIWLFESVDATSGSAAGNLRPIRGRINLNTATHEVLMRLLCGQGSLSTPADPFSSYYLVPSTGNVSSVAWNKSDAWVKSLTPVTLTQAQASALADAIIKLRPLRKMSDLILGGSDGMGLNSPSIDPNQTFTSLQTGGNSSGGAFDSQGNYTGFVADAILGRLAQFGTVRAQSYTVDIVARATKTIPGGQIVTTGEVRMLAHVYLDTFSRKAFVQSVEYR